MNDQPFLLCLLLLRLFLLLKPKRQVHQRSNLKYQRLETRIKASDFAYLVPTYVPALADS